MKLLDITFKDIIQASRNRTIFFFMFVVPIGIAVLFMIMFGGASDEGFQLPTIDVVVVDLDQGSLPDDMVIPGASSESNSDALPSQSMGEVLVQVLHSEVFSGLLSLTETDSENEARKTVDDRQASVAVIIPAGFTDSLIQSDQRSEVELYTDPTLTISPLIVESIVSQVIDNFDAARIGMEVTMEQLTRAGLELDQELMQDIANEHTKAYSAQSQADGGSEVLLVSVRPPSGAAEESNLLTEIVSVIFGGMMVFFAFFTGSASMESILAEEEKETLARLFTTPTSHRTILAGKGLAAVVILVVQVAVLLIFGALVLKIDWGAPATTILAGLGIIMVAAATGLFLVSMMKNTRQSGVIFGGVLTLTGMLGLIPVFTAGVPDQSQAIQLVSLLVPQGWAMRSLSMSIDGATIQEILPIFGVTMLWALVLALIGQHRMRRRFA